MCREPQDRCRRLYDQGWTNEGGWYLGVELWGCGWWIVCVLNAYDLILNNNLMLHAYLLHRENVGQAVDFELYMQLNLVILLNYPNQVGKTNS